MTKNAKKPKRKKRWFRDWFKDMEPLDYVLSVVGLCLGTAAALFPWHVYLHPEDYGPPRMTFSRGGVVPEAEVQAQPSGEYLFDLGTGRFVQDERRPGTVDRITTGKVNAGASAAAGDLKQAFPSNGARFTVLAVNGSRALVGDSEGVYLVRPRSRLPDGTLAMAFEEDDKGWHIVTSDERILRPE